MTRRRAPARRGGRKRSGASEETVAANGEGRRLRWLRGVVAAGLLAALLVAPELWFRHAFFGPFPPLDWLPAIPGAFDAVLYGALVLLLPPVALLPRPRALILAWCAIFAVKAAADMSVWQPYFYQYVFMLLAPAVATRRGRHDVGPVLNVERLIVASVYFWSGVNKVNYGFLTAGLDAVPGLEKLLSPLSGWISARSLAPLSLLMPFVEIAIGVGLLVRGRARRVAATAAIAMHVLILLSIGPLGRNHNQVVWPWNVAMILFVCLLFFRDDGVAARRIVWGDGSRFHRFALVLFVICPLLSSLGLWPQSLSFRLYSYRVSKADIFVTESLRAALPPTAQAQLVPQSVFFNLAFAAGGPTRRVGPYVGGLSVSDWSLRELNAFVPSEPRVYRRVFEQVCTLAEAPSDAVLFIVTPPDRLTGATRQSGFTCGNSPETG